MISVILPAAEPLGELVSATHEIAVNTCPEPWYTDGFNLVALISLLMACISFGVAWRTLEYTRKTVESIEREAERDRINNDCQRLLFHDMVRHLYRNKICTSAIRIKLAGKHGYPSEEHLLKLQLLPEDIHPEQYYRDSERFRQLHEIAFKLRNYNTEIEVVMRHMLDPDTDEQTLRRDLGTLDFKPGYLVGCIIGTMDRIWPGDNRADIERLLRVQHEENCRNNPECNRADLSDIVLPDDHADGLFMAVFSGAHGNGDGAADANRNYEEFRRMVETDVAIECGVNLRGEEKIHIIPFRGGDERA